MIVTHKLKMDLTHCGEMPRVDVVQDDLYSRDLAISLYQNGERWMPARGMSVVVRYIKPDGTGGAYDQLPDGTTAWRIAGNVITVALAPQVCTVHGKVRLMVELVREQAVLSTFEVEVNVRRNPMVRTSSRDYYRVSRTLPDFGWTPNMFLGTDGEGRVVVREEPEGGVRSVNGIAPDEEGNVDLPMDPLPQPVEPKVGQFLRVASVDAAGRVTALDTAGTDAGEILWDGTMIFEPTAAGTPPKYVEHIWSDHEPPARMFHEGERILFTVNGAARIYTVSRDDLGSVYFGNRYLSFDQIEGEGDTGDDFSVTIWLEAHGFQYVCFARHPGTYQVRIERITAQADAVTLEAAKEYADTKTAEALEQARGYADSRRLAWTDTEKIVILPRQQIVAEAIMAGDEAGIYGAYFQGIPEALPPDSIVAIIDGVTYELENHPYADGNPDVGWYGNGHLFVEDQVQTDDHFCIMVDRSTGMAIFVITDPETGACDKIGMTHTVELYFWEETVHKMEERYLPEGFVGLRFIDIDKCEMSVDDIMDDLVKRGVPAVLSFWARYDDENWCQTSAMCSIQVSDERKVVCCNAGGVYYQWEKEGNTWSMGVYPAK